MVRFEKRLVFNNMIGNFACSTAGHDKGQIYVIIGESDGNVIVSDGRLKTVEKPKSKNSKHIQIIRKGCDISLRDKILSGDKAVNEAIKRAIKLYKREEENVKS